MKTMFLYFPFILVFFSALLCASACGNYVSVYILLLLLQYIAHAMRSASFFSFHILGMFCVRSRSFLYKHSKLFLKLSRLINFYSSLPLLPLYLFNYVRFSSLNKNGPRPWISLQRFFLSIFFFLVRFRNHKARILN